MAEQTLRLAVLKYGTVMWELDTIRHHGLDQANGFVLDIQGVAGNPAATIAFQGGAADVILSDWIWVARQRAAGKDFVFIPYSKAVGALMVPADSPVQTLADLSGQAIGIAGGPVDKSWLIMRAYAKHLHGLDLEAQTEQVFGAPPLIFKKALQKETQGSINFWHFLARMRAQGFRDLVSVSDAARGLGLDPEIPLLGYVVKGAFARQNPDLIAGFVAASRDAKSRLANDDKEWQRLRPRMKAQDNATFIALRDGFRAGIPKPDPIDRNAGSKFLELMAELGGEPLVGKADTLPDGTFYVSDN